jgi:hypothetical protein
VTVHLDTERWKALQLQRDEALLRHVAEGCDACDAFLEGLPGFDGEVDRALLSLTPRAPSTAADLEAFKRLRRSQRKPRRLGLWAGAGMALAAALGAVVVSDSLRPATQPWTGEKGSAASTALQVRAAIKSSRGTLTPVDDGARVPQGSALVFQVRSTIAGPGQLFLQRGEALPVALTQVGLVQGAQELERGSEGLLGVSLQGEKGPVSVWLVAAEAPMSQERALEAIRTGGTAGVIVAKVRVDVTP